MNLNKIKEDPIVALMYLERYVNRGSPSGFTAKHGVSSQYNPSTGLDSFTLPVFYFPENEVESLNLNTLSDKYGFDSKDSCVPFFVHPDMLDKFKNITRIQSPIRKNESKFFASPTSSERTLYIHQGSHNNPCYIKLHYDGVIGRVDRKLPKQKSVSGVEITNDISLAIVSGKSPECFTILPEDTSISVNNGDWSYIVRDATPVLSRDNHYLIPFFSLFSPDKNNPNSDVIFEQIVSESKIEPVALFSIIVSYIQRSYWYLVLEHGYLPELNAQNILIEVDSGFNITRIVIRDLQGWEKDLTIRERLGLSTRFLSYPYKCIKESDEEYFVRHSFSYDYKVGKYLFLELVNLLSESYNISEPVLFEIIKKQFIENTGDKALGHFRPWSYWYYHEDILLTGERPYLAAKNSKFRGLKNE